MKLCLVRGTAPLGGVHFQQRRHATALVFAVWRCGGACWKEVCIPVMLWVSCGKLPLPVFRNRVAAVDGRNGGFDL